MTGRVDIKAILADPELRAELFASMWDPGPDGTHPVLPVVVDPGDLYTILRCFFEAGTYGMLWTQAEQQAADRLNKALTGVNWEFRPEHLEGR